MEFRHIPLSQDEELQADRENQNGKPPPTGEACFVSTYMFIWIVFITWFLHGQYQPELLKLGRDASIFIEPLNPWIMKSMRVERINGTTNELMLYGFDKTPPLNIVTSLLENHKVTLPGHTSKEWVYFLNNGSKIEMSYNVTSSIPSHVYLSITGHVPGNSYLKNLLDGPMEGNSYPTNLLDGPMEGTGKISQDIPKSANYHISLYSSRIDIVEVELQIRITGLFYDKTNAYYNCTINVGSCSLKIPFHGGNIALLAFSDPKLGNGNDETLQLSYEPRWITYWIFIGGIVVFLLIVIVGSACLSSNESCPTIEGESIPLEEITCCTIEDKSISQENIESQGAPLIPKKYDNVECLGSSQDSDDPEDGSQAGSHNGNIASDHKFDNNTPLCAICFDAPRDCLFLPCSHCVSCYACGTKIAEVGGTCPICRRQVSVKKIYTV